MTQQSQNARLHQMLRQGEGTTIDFKFAITSAQKIAISVVAFANTKGGSLLVGVKDNAKIVGVVPDEEGYILERALKDFVKPMPDYQMLTWKEGSKVVVELRISPGKAKPYMAMNDDGRWLAYLRNDDENIAANGVWVKVQERLQSEKPSFTSLSEHEKKLLQYLEQTPTVTLNQFCKIASIPRYKAIRYLVNLICLEIIDLHITKKQNFYTLHEP